MVIQREQYRIVMSKEWQDRINNNQCPACGKPKEEWTRRKDWTNCSGECTQAYRKKVIYGWSHLRKKVFNRDNKKCVKCGGNADVADHIIPIALGGEQWDKDNIQTLCIDCDKVKTKQDQADIGKARAIERKLVHGQKQLKVAP